MKAQFLAVATFLAGIAAALPSATAEDAIAARDSNDLVELEIDVQAAVPLEVLFAEIETIPDEILLAGDEVTNDWLIEHGLRQSDAVIEESKRDVVVREAYDLVQLESRGFWGCVWAIGKAAIPAAKLLKIKKYIKALGGVKKAVKKVLKAGKNYKKAIKIGGPTLWNLIKLLTGIDEIDKECF
jgi:hypothetical protein